MVVFCFLNFKVFELFLDFCYFFEFFCDFVIFKIFFVFFRIFMVFVFSRDFNRFEPARMVIQIMYSGRMNRHVNVLIIYLIRHFQVDFQID